MHDKWTHTAQYFAIFRSLAKNSRVEELVCSFKPVELLVPTTLEGLSISPMPNITTLRLDSAHWTHSLAASEMYIGTLIASCSRLTRLEVNFVTTCARIFGATLEDGNNVQLPLEHLFMTGSIDGLTDPEIFSRHLRRLKTFGFQALTHKMLDVSWSLMAHYRIWPTQLYTRPQLDRGLSPFLQYIMQHPGLESLYYVDSVRNGNGDNPALLRELLAALVPRHARTLQELELFDSKTSWALSWPGLPGEAEKMKNQLGQLKSLRRLAIRIDWSMNSRFCSTILVRMAICSKFVLTQTTNQQESFSRDEQFCISPHTCDRHSYVLVRAWAISNIP